MTAHIRPGRRSAFLLTGETVLYQGVRGRHEHALVTVLPADQIRRRAILPVDLHDHALAVLITHVIDENSGAAGPPTSAGKPAGRPD